jgi:hypothetical protein
MIKNQKKIHKKPYEFHLVLKEVQQDFRMNITHNEEWEKEESF